jgi:hypothetical protein
MEILGRLLLAASPEWVGRNQRSQVPGRPKAWRREAIFLPIAMTFRAEEKRKLRR